MCGPRSVWNASHPQRNLPLQRDPVGGRRAYHVGVQRELEPEVMDDESEAAAYAAMDFAGPNVAFVERLLSLGARDRMLDVGRSQGLMVGMWIALPQLAIDKSGTTNKGQDGIGHASYTE